MPYKDKQGYTDWYNRNREEKIALSSDYYQKHKARKREWAKADHHRKRQLVFDHYGNRCECCGEAEPMFLTVDHINGGGRQHGLKIGNLYLWLVRNNFPDGFRLLCMNCNGGRERNGGVCPHRSK